MRKQNFPQAFYARFLMRDFCAQGPNTTHTNTHLSKFSFFEPRERKYHASKDLQGLIKGLILQQIFLGIYRTLVYKFYLDYCDSLLQVHSGIRGLVEENPRRKQKRLRSFLPTRYGAAARLPRPVAHFREHQHGRLPVWKTDPSLRSQGHSQPALPTAYKL